MRLSVHRILIAGIASGALLAACSPPPVAPAPDASAPAVAADPDAADGVAAPADARDDTTGTGMACVMSGTISMMGITEDVEDCMSTDGAMPEADFRTACGNLAGAMGGSASIEYRETCPTPAQGSCRNFAGSGLDAYYYKRRPDDVANLPRSCSALGGTWSAAD